MDLAATDILSHSVRPHFYRPIGNRIAFAKPPTTAPIHNLRGRVVVRKDERYICFDLPRSLIVGNEAVLRTLHTGDSSDLPEASTEVASQDFQPVKIRLSCVWRTVKAPEAWVRPSVITPRQKLLIGEKLPDAEQHRLD